MVAKDNLFVKELHQFPQKELEWKLHQDFPSERIMERKQTPNSHAFPSKFHWGVWICTMWTLFTARPHDYISGFS